MSSITDGIELQFCSLYDELRSTYEEEYKICVSNEAWNEYVANLLNNNVRGFAGAIVVANDESKNKVIESDDLEESVSDDSDTDDEEIDNSYEYVTEKDLKYSIDPTDASIKTDNSGTKNLSPVCAGFFRPVNANTSKVYEICPNIETIIACFNATSVDHRVFNEIHYILAKSDNSGGDPDLTMGFGHHANEGLDGLFSEMKSSFPLVFKKFCNAIKDFILDNSKNNNKDNKSYLDQFWADSVISSFISNNKLDPKEENIVPALCYFLTGQSLSDWANKFVEGEKLGPFSQHGRPLLQEFTKDWEESLFSDFTQDISKTVKINKVKQTQKRKKYEWFVEDNILIAGNNLLQINKNSKQKTIVSNNNKIINAVKDSKFESDTNVQKLLSFDFDALMNKMQLELNSAPADGIENDRSKFIAWKNQYNDELYQYISGIESYYEYNLYVDKVNQILKNAKKNSTKQLQKISFSIIRPRYIQLDLFPGGDGAIMGYWFHDALKKAMTLKEVCWWQIIYWINHYLILSYDTSAANAVMTNWKSSGSVDRALHIRLDKDKKNYISINNTLSKEDKAVLYWNNYNATRKCLRSRNALIWKRWFENDDNQTVYYDNNKGYLFIKNPNTYKGKDIIFSYTEKDSGTDDFTLIPSVIDSSKIIRSDFFADKIELYKYIKNNVKLFENLNIPNK